ncbi:hypothetical protein IIA15_10250 [candidate division TA06 bacterium]|nr:hypothetical protein [candidate division TA06 bacterium]
MTKELPYIWRKETKRSANGHTLEEKQLTVQGKELKEVEKAFDKEWGRK